MRTTLTLDEDLASRLKDLTKINQNLTGPELVGLSWFALSGFIRVATSGVPFKHDLSGKEIQDAHLAAIAIEHGASLGTFNSDFHRFADLKLDFLGAR